jgi:hypothetical protein
MEVERELFRLQNLIPNKFLFYLESEDLPAISKSMHELCIWELENSFRYIALLRKRKCIRFFLRKVIWPYLPCDLLEFAVAGNSLEFFIGQRIKVEKCSKRGEYLGIWDSTLKTAIKLQRNKYVKFLIKYANYYSFDINNLICYAVQYNNLWVLNYCSLLVKKVNNKCIDYFKNDGKIDLLLHLFQIGVKFRKRHISLNPSFFARYCSKKLLINFHVENVCIFTQWMYGCSYKTKQNIFIKLIKYFSFLIYKFSLIKNYFPTVIQKEILKRLLFFPIDDNLVLKAKITVIQTRNNIFCNTDAGC